MQRAVAEKKKVSGEIQSGDYVLLKMKGLNFKLQGLFVLKSLYGSNNTNIYYLFRLKKETSQVLEAQ